VTPKGRQLVQKAMQRLRDGERELLATLSDAECAMLIELLHKVACCRPARRAKPPAAGQDVDGA
jgi:hypothetical protein